MNEAAMTMTMTLRRFSEPPVLEVGGEIDAVSAPQLETQFARLPQRDIVIDVTGVDFCGASGLEALTDLHSRLRKDGCALCISGATAEMRGVVRRLGLDERLPMRPTVPEASAMLLERSILQPHGAA